jgi:hypothetical protein
MEMEITSSLPGTRNTKPAKTTESEKDTRIFSCLFLIQLKRKLEIKKRNLKKTDKAVGLYNANGKYVRINSIINEAVKDESGG